MFKSSKFVRISWAKTFLLEGKSWCQPLVYSAQRADKFLQSYKCVVCALCRGVAGCMAPFTAARSACRLRCRAELWLNTEAAGPGTAFNLPSSFNLASVLLLCSAQAQLGHKDILTNTATSARPRPVLSVFESVRLSVDVFSPACVCLWLVFHPFFFFFFCFKVQFADCFIHKVAKNISRDMGETFCFKLHSLRYSEQQ